MVTMGLAATTTRGLQRLLHVSRILKEEDIVLAANNRGSLVEEDIHLWRVESVLGGLELDWVVQRVLGLLHGLFHVLHVLVSFGFVTVERFLGAWYLDVRKVKKADLFTYPLLRVPHDLDIILVGVVEVRKSIPLVSAVTYPVVHSRDGEESTNVCLSP